MKCATKIFTKLETQNRRTLDQISAKCYFYYSRAHEIVGKLDSVSGDIWNNCDDYNDIIVVGEKYSPQQAENCNAEK